MQHVAQLCVHACCNVCQHTLGMVVPSEFSHARTDLGF